MFVISCFPGFIRYVSYKEIKVHLGTFKTHVYNNSEPASHVIVTLTSHLVS